MKYILILLLLAACTAPIEEIVQEQSNGFTLTYNDLVVNKQTDLTVQITTNNEP